MENYRIHPRHSGERDKVDAILNHSWENTDQEARRKENVGSTSGAPIGVDKTWQTERLKGMMLMSKSIERSKQRHSYRSYKRSKKKADKPNYDEDYPDRLMDCYDRGDLDDGLHNRDPRLRAHSTSDDYHLTELLIDLPQCNHQHHQPNMVTNRDVTRPLHDKKSHNYTSAQMYGRIDEFTSRLQRQKHLSKRDKITVAHLQHEISRQKALTQRECLMRDFDRERMLRIDAEQRLEELSGQNDSYQSRIQSLTRDMQNMEDMVRGMVHYRTKTEQLKQDKANLTADFENTMEKYQSRIASLEHENMQLLMDMKTVQDKYETNSNPTKKSEGVISDIRSDLSGCNASPVRHADLNKSATSGASRGASISATCTLCAALQECLRSQQAAYAKLLKEQEQQRHQYERCLDDIANQVVNALLAQKGLREECIKLQDRVRDLEKHNRQMKDLFKNTIHFNGQSIRQATLGKSLISPDPCTSSKYPPIEDNSDQSECLLERKPEGQSGTIFSEESLASLHSMFSDQDPLHSDGMLFEEPHFSTQSVCNDELSKENSYEDLLGKDNNGSDSGLPTHSCVSSHQSLSTQPSVNSTNRLVVSPSSTTSSHFCVLETRVDSGDSHCVLQKDPRSHLINSTSSSHCQQPRSTKGTPDDSTASTMTTSPGERLLQLSDSFPEKLMILTSPDIQSPVEEYLTFSDDSADDVLTGQSTMSLNDVLEEQTDSTSKDDTFDTLPAFDHSTNDSTSITNQKSYGTLQSTFDNVITSHAHEQWKHNLATHELRLQPSIQTRNCVIQRPNSLDLLGNSSKLTHVFDEYLVDSSSSNSDMSSSRVGQLTVHVSNLLTENKPQHKSNAQSSPTIYHHLNGQKMSVVNSKELNEVCSLPNKDFNRSQDDSSTSYSPPSLSSAHNNSNLQTPLSYGSPPMDYSVATASTMPDLNDRLVQSKQCSVIYNNNACSTSIPGMINTGSPDSAMQQSFSSSSGGSDDLHRGGPPVMDKQLHHRDDGYASNSTTSVSLSDMHKLNTNKVAKDLGKLTEKVECHMDSNGSVKNSCLISNNLTTTFKGSSKVEDDHIVNIKNMTAYVEERFEIQQLKMEPSPVIKMPSKLRPDICNPLRRTASDSKLVIRNLNAFYQRIQSASIQTSDQTAPLTDTWYSDSSLLISNKQTKSLEDRKQLLEDYKKLHGIFIKHPRLMMDRSCVRLQKASYTKITPYINWMSLSDSGSDCDEDMKTCEVDSDITSDVGAMCFNSGNDWLHGSNNVNFSRVYERPVVHTSQPFTYTPDFGGFSLYSPLSPLSPEEGRCMASKTLLQSPTSNVIPNITTEANYTAGRALRKPFDHLKKEAMSFVPCGRTKEPHPRIVHNVNISPTNIQKKIFSVCQSDCLNNEVGDRSRHCDSNGSND